MSWYCTLVYVRTLDAQLVGLQLINNTGAALRDPGHEQRLIFVLVEILVGFVLNGVRRVSRAWIQVKHTERRPRTENNQIGRDGGDNKVLRCEGGLCWPDAGLGTVMAGGKLWFMRGRGNDQVSFNPLPPSGFWLNYSRSLCLGTWESGLLWWVVTKYIPIFWWNLLSCCEVWQIRLSVILIPDKIRCCQKIA